MRKKRSIRGQPGHGVEFIAAEPAQSGVLAGLRPATNDPGLPYPQHGIGPDAPILAYASSDRDLDAELLTAFPDQRLLLRLRVVDLSARQLPTTGEVPRIRALRGEQPAVVDDRGADDNDHIAIFAHRGASVRGELKRWPLENLCVDPWRTYASGWTLS